MPEPAHRLDVIGHNQTEGRPIEATKQCDILIAQETDHAKIRAGLPGWSHHFPRTDPHQSISWRPDVVRIGEKGWERFHRSGTAEHWPFKSPGRGLIWATGHLADHPDIKVVVAGLWFLNSWGKTNQEGPARRRIVEDRSIPVVEKMLKKWHDEGRTVILEGDANNIRWGGHLPGMTQIKTHGLDRAWVTTGGALKLAGKVTEGPTTGVGNDMRHHAVLFTLATKKE